MPTIKQLQKETNKAPKFVLFTNEFGCDMYVADPKKWDGIITDTVDEALIFSVGFDSEDVKLKYWTAVLGYSNLTVKHL